LRNQKLDIMQDYYLSNMQTCRIAEWMS